MYSGSVLKHTFNLSYLVITNPFPSINSKFEWMYFIHRLQDMLISVVSWLILSNYCIKITHWLGNWKLVRFDQKGFPRHRPSTIRQQLIDLLFISLLWNITSLVANHNYFIIRTSFERPRVTEYSHKWVWRHKWIRNSFLNMRNFSVLNLTTKTMHQMPSQIFMIHFWRCGGQMK